MNKAGLHQNIRSLPPASFALVMATGIISIAAHLMQYEWISQILFLLNNVFYLVLLALTLFRTTAFFPDLLSDLSDHGKGPGFLTITAGSGILGTQYILLKHMHGIALVLLIIGLCTWLLLLYSFFIFITVKKEKPSLETGMNGSWLLFVVATQSLSILSSNLIQPNLPFASPTALFFSFAAFLLAVLFYIVLISIIFYRTAFYPMKPDEFQPSYWIDTGASAITVVAGVALIKNFGLASDYQNFIPVIRILCLLFWITACWWLPVIAILEIWRHRTVPVKYQSGYWSLVFPLGMFTVCSWQMGDIFTTGFIKTLAGCFIFIALIAWLLTFSGLCRKLYMVFRNRA